MKNIFILCAVFLTQIALATTTQTNFKGTVDLGKSILDPSKINEKLSLSVSIKAPTDLKVTRAYARVEVDYGDPDLSNQPITYTCHTTGQLSPAKLELTISSDSQTLTAEENLTATVQNLVTMSDENAPCFPRLTGNEKVTITGNYNNPFQFEIKVRGKIIALELHTPFLYASGHINSRSDVYENVELDSRQVNGMQWFAFPNKDHSTTLGSHAELLFISQSKY